MIWRPILTDLLCVNPILIYSSRSICTTSVSCKTNRWYHVKRVFIDKGKDFPCHLTSEVSDKRKSFAQSLLTDDLNKMREAFPEFLPPLLVAHRHKVANSLERRDMFSRRSVIELPEFYVGSVLAVTVSDPYSEDGVSRFVGICILREGQGLNAAFTLRNVVDGEGIEIRYDLYNPTIRSIDVLKLEKRPDPHLLYLRDALPEYSTFPFDMEPELRKTDEPVPTNYIRVKMNPRPWSKRWENQAHLLYGFESMSTTDIRKRASERLKKKEEEHKYDTMKTYREHIPEDKQLEIWEDVLKQYNSTEGRRRRARRARILESQA